MKKNFLFAFLIALILPASLCALEMRVWTTPDAPTFDAESVALPLIVKEESVEEEDDYDDDFFDDFFGEEEGPTPVVRFFFKGEGLRAKVECLEPDFEAADFYKVWDTPFDGEVQSETYYEMEFSGGRERFPSVRLILTDADGNSLKWNDLDDGAYGATFFIYSTEDRANEIGELAKQYYARHHKGKTPKFVELISDGYQVTVHLYNKKLFFFKKTLAKYIINIDSGMGDDLLKEETVCLWQ